jgi:cold shock CspA family protein
MCRSHDNRCCRRHHRAHTGDEAYLHRNAVLGRGFDKLREGDKVRYVVHEGEGEQGLQASTVIPL